MQRRKTEGEGWDQMNTRQKESKGREEDEREWVAGGREISD